MWSILTSRLSLGVRAAGTSPIVSRTPTWLNFALIHWLRNRWRECPHREWWVQGAAHARLVIQARAQAAKKTMRFFSQGALWIVSWQSKSHCTKQETPLSQKILCNMEKIKREYTRGIRVVDVSMQNCLSIGTCRCN